MHLRLVGAVRTIRCDDDKMNRKCRESR